MPRKTLKKGSKAKKDVYASFKMPKPDGKHGHTSVQIYGILKELRIPRKRFWDAFGVNTVAIDEFGTYNYYTCDIERALFNATKGRIGVKHDWD